MISRTVSDRQDTRATANVEAGGQPIPITQLGIVLAVVLAAVVCAIGVCLLQSDMKPAPVAVAKTPAHRRVTPAADPPRTVAMEGSVEAYDPDLGMLSLVLNGIKYRVRLPNAIASQGSCELNTIIKGRVVSVTFAAYLNGPLNIVAVNPADAGSASCSGM
jgi:hypothetical protein